MTKFKLDVSDMKNIVWESQTCSCRVTFFKGSQYRSSRMDACTVHLDASQREARDHVYRKAVIARDNFLSKIEDQETLF